MIRSGVKLCILLAAVLPLLLTAGCATADRKVNVLYEQAVHAAGGTGELYLVKGVQPAAAEGGLAVQWVIGTVKDRDGNRVGSVVTETMPADLVQQALGSELKAAGYTVIPVGEMPQGAAKGISLGNILVSLDEVASLVKVEANCSVKVSAEIWRDGKVITRVAYEAANSGTTVTDRDRFLREMLQKSLQNLMQRAVPEMIKQLEQK